MKKSGMAVLGFSLLTALFVLAAPTSYNVSGKVVYDAKGPTGRFKGSNESVSGNFSLEGNKLSGKICVDLSKWASGEPVRDTHTRGMFEVDKYPQACMDLSSVEGNIASGNATLVGSLNIHGKDQALKVPVTIKMNGNKMLVEGQFETKVTDWGMKRPSLLGITVDDLVKVAFSAEASPQ
ncbi:YceI family protein [Meiothermus sp.]|uniref:YceI family protein n=1 Tax=Meiothermus sp. TaxID=1955249 RepID=UPI0021DBFC51|nr:YceI family protein [Meiothermus sp.]GIW24350.1 MAG: hypothetical protein KatS3mg069_0617 [Meiothermus sp.]